MRLQAGCDSRRCCCFLALASAQQKLTLHHHDAAQQLPGTIVVPASDFFERVPAGDSNDGRFPAGAWFFNNSTLNMSVADDVVAHVPVKEAGTYHLYVRSVGTPASSFQVSIDGEKDARDVMAMGALSLKRGGDFILKAGDGRDPADLDPAAAFAERAGADQECATSSEDDLKPLELAARGKAAARVQDCDLEHREVRRCGWLRQVRDRRHHQRLLGDHVCERRP